jgi:hypothetical protein
VYCPDGTQISASKLLTMLAMAAASWGLVYVAALGLWTAVEITRHEPDTTRFLAIATAVTSGGKGSIHE